MKKFLGALVAFGAVMAMAVGAQAATYSAGSVSGAEGTAIVPVIVTPDDGSTESVNGYIITLTYDGTKISPKASATADATGDTCYATVDTAFADGVLVSGVVSGSGTSEEVLAVAWASADAVSVDAAAYMATVEFTVDESATEDVAIAVNVTAVTSDGSSIDDESTYTVASGEITLGSDVVYGDADGDGSVTSTDASTVKQYLANLTTLDSKYEDQADVDGDGSVTSTDASLIKQYLANLINKFPIEETE